MHLIMRVGLIDTLVLLSLLALLFGFFIRFGFCQLSFLFFNHNFYEFNCILLDDIILNSPLSITLSFGVIR